VYNKSATQCLHTIMHRSFVLASTNLLIDNLSVLQDGTSALERARLFFYFIFYSGTSTDPCR
jgi:hypothetical protein